MAPRSSSLAWKIPWTEEPGELQSMGSLAFQGPPGPYGNPGLPGPPGAKVSICRGVWRYSHGVEAGVWAPHWGRLPSLGDPGRKASESPWRIRV